MKVEEIMVKDVKTIKKDRSIREATIEMRKNGIGSLIVLDKTNRIVGIITDWDIIKCVSERKDFDKCKISEVMSSNIIVASPDTDVIDIAQIMAKKGVKKIPIVKNGILVGIVSASDIVAAEPKLFEYLAELMLIPRKKKNIAG